MEYGYDQITQEVWCGIQGQDCPGGTARGSDGAGVGEAARRSPEPDLWLEEAGSRQGGEPFRARRERVGGWRGGARARDGEALYQDWPVDGRKGFLGQEARAMSVPERRAMVERPCENLSVRRQCALLNLARSGIYRPGPVTSADDLALMRRIHELHLKWPLYGSRGDGGPIPPPGHTT